MKEQLAIVRQRLGGPGASGRAADAILEVAQPPTGDRHGGRERRGEDDEGGPLDDQTPRLWRVADRDDASLRVDAITVMPMTSRSSSTRRVGGRLRACRRRARPVDRRSALDRQLRHARGAALPEGRSRRAACRCGCPAARPAASINVLPGAPVLRAGRSRRAVSRRRAVRRFRRRSASARASSASRMTRERADRW